MFPDDRSIATTQKSQSFGIGPLLGLIFLLILKQKSMLQAKTDEREGTHATFSTPPKTFTVMFQAATKNRLILFKKTFKSHLFFADANLGPLAEVEYPMFEIGANYEYVIEQIAQTDTQDCVRTRLESKGYFAGGLLGALLFWKQFHELLEFGRYFVPMQQVALRDETEQKQFLPCIEKKQNGVQKEKNLKNYNMCFFLGTVKNEFTKEEVALGLHKWTGDYVVMFRKK